MATELLNILKTELEKNDNVAKNVAQKRLFVDFMRAAAATDESGKATKTLTKLFKGESIDDIMPVNPESLIDWSEIKGADREKRDIERNFLTPLLFPHLFEQGKGLLMYGPPGTGKTYICKAIVSQFKKLTGQDISLYAPNGANIKGGIVGATEQNILKYFAAAQASADELKEQIGGEKKTNSILFMDEVEALAGRRDGKDIHMTSSVNVLLQLLDGAGGEYKDVLFIAATNIPWALDSAILRRFTSTLFIDLPTDGARFETIKSEIMRRIRVTNCDSQLCNAFFVKLTEWSGASTDANADEFLNPFLLQTGRTTRGGISGMLGYTLSDISRVIKIALNRVSENHLYVKGRASNCVFIPDPQCMNCDPCKLSDDDRDSIKLDIITDIIGNEHIFKNVFESFATTTNIEEYRNYIRYYKNPSGFTPPAN